MEVEVPKEGVSSSEPKRSGPLKRKRGGKAAAQRRQDDYRRKSNREALADPNFPVGRQAMDRKYGAMSQGLDFKDCESSVVTVSKSAILPITTRGIGFAVGASYAEAYRYGAAKVTALCSVNEAFRAALIQFAMRLSHQEDGRIRPFPVEVDRADIYLSMDIQTLVEGYHDSFSLVASLLSGVGWFEHNSCGYQTGLVPDVGAQLRATSAFELVASNLRPVCEGLAGGAAHTAAFIAMNPIPGAVFANGRLDNLDDVVPAGWPTRELVRHDLERYSNLCAFLRSKKSSFVSRVDYTGKAVPFSLVYRCCTQATAGTARWTAEDGFACTLPFDVCWYSIAKLDHNLWVRGILSLLCEKYRDYLPERLPQSATETVAADWLSLANTALRR